MKKLLAIFALILSFTGLAIASTLPSSIPSVFETYLSAQMAKTDTTATLAIGTLRDGTTLTGYHCFTIDANSPSLEYVCGTASGTSITGLTRGIDAVSGTTTVTSLEFAHRIGADVKITDYPILTIMDRTLNGVDTLPNVLNYASTIGVGSIATSSQNIPTANWVGSNFVNTSGTQTVNGLKTFTSTTTISGASIVVGYDPSNANDVATKHYVDITAASGAPNANTTTKGIVQEATVAQVNSATASGSTGANLFMTPADFGFSNFASSSPATFSTTTSVQIGTSTLMTVPPKPFLQVTFYASSTPGSNGLKLYFNGDNTSTNYGYQIRNLNSTGSTAASAVPFIQLTNNLGVVEGGEFYITVNIVNVTGAHKMGNYTIAEYTQAGAASQLFGAGSFFWNSTSAISSISIAGQNLSNSIDTDLYMSVAGY